MSQISRTFTPRRGAYAAKAVGSMVPSVTRKAFERFGFSTAALLTDWAGIVGNDLARYTSPDRLKWPRAGHESDGEGGPERQAATLILRVDLGRGLDIQYRTRQIIERINSHFGYRAVAELRIIQAPVEGALPPAPVAKPPRRAFDRASTEPLVAAVADEGLRAALEKMQAGLTNRGHR